MITTKFEEMPVNINMEVDLQKSLVEQGVNPVEIVRVIESFTEKLLSAKASGEVRLENEETNATIDIDIAWDENTKVDIQVVEVDLKKGKKERLRNQPNGSRFDLSAQSDESGASKGEPIQH